ncbi:hypothetical protein J6590_084117 [Homalodisca vitripennis]|nr:hypothetical protein J6590_084117 [Homalodisca vitripennis]
METAALITSKYCSDSRERYKVVYGRLIYRLNKCPWPHITDDIGLAMSQSETWHVPGELLTARIK